MEIVFEIVARARKSSTKAATSKLNKCANKRVMCLQDGQQDEHQTAQFI